MVCWAAAAGARAQLRRCTVWALALDVVDASFVLAVVVAVVVGPVAAVTAATILHAAAAAVAAAAAASAVHQLAAAAVLDGAGGRPASEAELPPQGPWTTSSVGGDCKEAQRLS